MKRIISTWIYLDSKQEKSTYTQIRGNSSSSKFQEIYWRCIVVFFETSRRYNKAAEHKLFTNSENIPIVDGFDIKDYLRKNGVEVITLDNKYPLPEGYHENWRNQFFVFSIIDYLKIILSKDDLFLLLDSDCIFTKPIDDLFNLKTIHPAITYDIGYPENHTINGITRLEMKDIFEDFELFLDFTPSYSGGEALFANGEFLKNVAADFPDLFEKLIDRFHKKKIKFNEEAHVLSFFYYKFGAWIGGLNNQIRRLWTNPNVFRSIKEGDRDLPIWHLPGEKKEGFRLFFKFITKGLSLQSINETEYQQLIFRHLFDDKRYNTIFYRAKRKLASLAKVFRNK